MDDQGEESCLLCPFYRGNNDSPKGCPHGQSRRAGRQCAQPSCQEGLAVFQVSRTHEGSLCGGSFILPVKAPRVSMVTSKCPLPASSLCPDLCLVHLQDANNDQASSPGDQRGTQSGRRLRKAKLHSHTAACIQKSENSCSSRFVCHIIQVYSCLYSLR